MLDSTRNTGTGNLTQGIVQALGSAIVKGSYANGQPFPVEAELCKQYGASRSVLREAVKMLTAKGLLSARPRQGTKVEPEERWNLLDPDVLGWLVERKYSPALLIQFTQMRLAVEPQAARLAALNADTAGHRMIRSALERMLAADRGEDDPLESDIAFHVAILQASGNPFFAQLRELVDTALRISIRTTNRYKGVRLASIEAHARIADAIEKREPEQALEYSRVLVQEALNLIEAGAEANG